LAILRVQLRAIRREPGFCATVILLLGLGIATTCLLLTAIDRLLLRPIDVPHAELLVRAAVLEPKGMVYTFFPYQVYEDFERQTKTLSATAADANVDVAVSRGAMPEPAVAHMVSGSYFGVLEVPAALGRTLIPGDDRGDGIAVVLSYGLWQRQFGGSSSALGTRVFIDGQAFVVVGVMPRGFFGTSLDTPADLWIPLASEARISTVSLESPQSYRTFDIFGRLKAGVPLGEAQDEFRALLASFLAAHPDLAGSAERGTVEPIARRVTWKQDQLSGFLLLLLGAVGLTFAILCANAAGLFVARAARRERETAVRLSLGATWAQLLRQQLGEAWPLALLGATIGVALAWAAGPLVLRFVPAGQGPLPISLRPGLSVTAVSVGIALAVSLVFGGAAAWLRPQENLFFALRGGAAGARLSKMGRGLVMAQIGLAVSLVFGAGLLVRTLSRLAAADPGFNRDHLAVFTLDTGMSGLRTFPPDLPNRLMSRAISIPGVRSAAVAAMELMQGRGLVTSTAPAGRIIQRQDFMNSSLNEVSPGYFETLGIPLLAGRPLSQEDGKHKNPTPVIISTAFARFLFAHEQALGQTFGNGELGETAKAEYEVVGIVGDAKYRSLREIPPPTYYVPLERRLDKDANFVLYVRTAGPPASIMAKVRAALYGIEPNLPFTKVETMPEELTDSVWQERLLGFLTAVFAGLALVLSATAIYGVLAYELNRRTREIAVRIALGAQTTDVATLVAKDIGLTVLLGVVVGLFLCLGLGRFLQAYLFRIATWDAPSLHAAGALVCAAALFACLGPTRRAVRLPPALVLRDE
jgi:predicted permease